MRGVSAGAPVPGTTPCGGPATAWPWPIAALRGIVADGLLTNPRGLGAINDEEYLDWICRHGGPAGARGLLGRPLHVRHGVRFCRRVIRTIRRSVPERRCCSVERPCSTTRGPSSGRWRPVWGTWSSPRCSRRCRSGVSSSSSSIGSTRSTRPRTDDGSRRSPWADRPISPPLGQPTILSSSPRGCPVSRPRRESSSSPTPTGSRVIPSSPIGAPGRTSSSGSYARVRSSIWSSSPSLRGWPHTPAPSWPS